MTLQLSYILIIAALFFIQVICGSDNEKAYRTRIMYVLLLIAHVLVVALIKK